MSVANSFGCSSDEAGTAAALAEVDYVLTDRVLVETENTPRPIWFGGRSRAPATVLSESSPARLEIRLADSHGHRSEASYLVRKMYGWRGYVADPAHSHPNCVTLAASDDEKMLATITVGFDSPAGMAVGTDYPEEIARMRAAGSRLCEFTRLAVDRTEHSLELLAMMFHVAYMYARHLRARTDLLIEVNPRHASFYTRFLGFKRASEVRMCPRVNAPAVLMWLPLDHAEEQIARFGGTGSGKTPRRSLYPLFFSPDEEAGILGRLRASE